MLLFRSITSTCHIALVLLTVGRWMYSIRASWEDVNKKLTQLEILFAQFSSFYTNYFYILAIAWFLGCLMGLVTSSRRVSHDPEQWA